jgi:hypothetical protein
MTEKTDHPFRPGVEVALADCWGDVSRLAKVNKVFKNGNVVLEGSAQQYQPIYSGGVKWFAVETGVGSYGGRGHIEPVDEKSACRIRATERRNRFHRAVEQLSQLRGADVTDDQCASVEFLVAQLSKKKDAP